MSKEQLLILSLIMFGLAILFLAIDYFLFHHVARTGIVKEKQAEAGKPFVTMLVGNLGVLCFFTSILSLIISFFH